ncbi:unnamed protein product [Prunus brigantina]
MGSVLKQFTRYGTLSLDGEAGQIYTFKPVIQIILLGLSFRWMRKSYYQEALMVH